AQGVPDQVDWGTEGRHPVRQLGDGGVAAQLLLVGVDPGAMSGQVPAVHLGRAIQQANKGIPRRGGVGEAVHEHDGRYGPGRALVTLFGAHRLRLRLVGTRFSYQKLAVHVRLWPGKAIMVTDTATLETKEAIAIVRIGDGKVSDTSDDRPASIVNRAATISPGNSRPRHAARNANTSPSRAGAATVISGRS